MRNKFGIHHIGSKSKRIDQKEIAINPELNVKTNEMIDHEIQEDRPRLSKE